MELKHMKNDPADKRGSSKPMMAKESAYPHGLTIMLDKASLQKLGMGDVQVSGKVKIEAKGHVVSVSKRDEKGGDNSHHVTVQLTHMGVDHGGGEKPKPKKKLGEMGMEEYASARDPKLKDKKQKE